MRDHNNGDNSNQSLLLATRQKLHLGREFVCSMRMVQLATATPVRHRVVNNHLCDKNKVYVCVNVVVGLAN